MEKRIPLIRMGGTIGTTINNGTMEPNKHASLALLNLYNQRKDAYPVQWIQEQDFGVLSENNTVNTWNQLLESLREIVQRNQNYDGIIITHGTDTLAYTAALLSVVCKGMNLPIFLVSSHRPLLDKTGNPDPHANGVDNFATAVSAIYQGITPGVYVPYRNPSNGVMHMHKGEQITQCPIYSDDFSSYPFAR
ncbi:MAG: asparaginase, partial [Clostridia bacterium]|nr:asparaginase [Clostridia bacterium]